MYCSRLQDRLMFLRMTLHWGMADEAGKMRLQKMVEESWRREQVKEMPREARLGGEPTVAH